MFSSIVTRIARIAKPARDYSAEHAARAAARKQETERLARAIGAHMAREARSERDANADLVAHYIARETAKARDMQRTGHRLFKATARALVNASQA